MTSLNNFDQQRDSRLESLFGDLPPEVDTIVKLPSESRFYPNANPNVTITPIKFDDEKHLASSFKNKENPINLIISKCTKGLETSNILLIDKLYLLLKIREISYGAEYPAKITCNKCNTDSEVNINLSNLIVNTIPMEVTDPREITLPKLNKTAKVRFPRVSDEPFLATQEQIYNNVWRFVTELNGITDPVFIAKAIPKMHIMDIKFIISNIMRSDLGLDPRFIFECGSCGDEAAMTVPINENFFLVS